MMHHIGECKCLSVPFENNPHVTQFHLANQVDLEEGHVKKKTKRKREIET